MALWWTKRSLPPSSGVMKPKPFSSLNHLTVPVAMMWVFLPLLRAAHRGRRPYRRCDCAALAAAPLWPRVDAPSVAALRAAVANLLGAGPGAAAPAVREAPAAASGGGRAGAALRPASGRAPRS